MKEVVTQIPRFSNLARFLLLIPHSNSFCDSVFSTVKKILTDSKQNLGKDIVGRDAHSRVYESETGIRNNLVGLIIPKINIFLNNNNLHATSGSHQKNYLKTPSLLLTETLLLQLVRIEVKYTYIIMFLSYIRHVFIKNEYHEFAKSK